MDIIFKGEKTTIGALAALYNVPWSTLKNRYNAGYRDDELVKQTHVRTAVFNGEALTLKTLSERTKVPMDTIKGRKLRNEPYERIISLEHLGKNNKNPAKLSIENVLRIKYELMYGLFTQSEIAKHYGIHQTTVSDIKRRRRWKDITLAEGYIYDGTLIQPIE